MRQHTLTCDCCSASMVGWDDGKGFRTIGVDLDLSTLTHNLHSDVRSKIKMSKEIDLCGDCLQFITGENLHGSQDKLATALSFLIFKFVVDGLKAEAAEGRAGETEKEGDK